MKKQLIIVLILFSILSAKVFATSITITNGNIATNTTWSVDTVFVQVQVTVNNNTTLTIAPGTRVILQGYYEFLVNGRLQAIGTPSDSIFFTVADTTGFDNLNYSLGGWPGISFNFDPSNDSSKIAYCRFEFGKTVINKYHGLEGGVMYMNNSSKVAIRNSTFYRCAALSGGAIYVYNSAPLIDNCLFYDCTAMSSGGAIYANGYANPKIQNCIFRNNNAEMGAAIALEECTYGSIIANCLIESNTGTFGAAIYLSLTQADILNNKIINNHQVGGGLKNGTGSIVEIDDGSIRMVNNLIANNSGEWATPVWNDFGTLEFFNNTVVFNETEQSFVYGMYLGGYSFIKNNIFWGNNSFNTSNQFRCWEGNAEFYNNLIQGGKGSIYEELTKMPFTGPYVNCFDLDPKFVDEINYDYTLLSSSPCINNGYADTAGMILPLLDLAGNPRIYNGTTSKIDIGAYEYQGEPSMLYISDDITENTTWCAENIYVLGKVEVAENVTLTICPGTNVWFKGGESFYYEDGIDCGYMIVKGNIIAQGTELQPISFDIFNYGNWGGIVLDTSSSNNVFEHCLFANTHEISIEDRPYCSGAISIIESNNNIINKCMFYNIIGDAILLHMAPNCAISNNYIEYPSTYCLNIFQSNTVNIVNNYLLCNSTYNILLEQSNADVFGNLINGGVTNVYYCSPNIVNNTIVNGDGIFLVSDISSICHPIIVNNIFYANTQDIFFLDAYTQAELSNNILYSTPNVVYTDMGGNIIEPDPGFVAAGQGNYRLTSTSPAIDAGTNTVPCTVPPVDLSGRQRVIGDIDMGAFEYQSLPLAGIYTIGGYNPDFMGFDDAIAALKTFGVSDSVVFKVRDGSYNELIEIKEIAGASELNYIKFESENPYTFIDLMSSYQDSCIVILDSADYITFNRFNFNYQQMSINPLILLKNGANNNTFKNCMVNGITDTRKIFASIDGPNNNNAILNCNILNGGFGVFANALVSANKDANWTIMNNSFQNQNLAGVYMNFADNSIIKDNSFFGPSITGYNGININNHYGALRIESNEINTYNLSNGIVLNNCNSTEVNQGIIKNNMLNIMTYGFGKSYGIKVTNSDYQHFYFNTVRLTQIGDTSAAIYFGVNNNNIKVYNNILSTFYGLAYAIYKETSTNISACDYNCIYTDNSVKFAYYNGSDMTNLADWTFNTGFDSNSVSVQPVFMSDLHIGKDLNLNGKGLFIPTHTDFDFDGNPRSNPPDIGADEFNVIDLGQDIVTCDEVVVLSVPYNANYTYSWSTDLPYQNINPATIAVNFNLTYSTTVTDFPVSLVVVDNNGIESFDEVMLQQAEKPSATLYYDSLDVNLFHFYSYINNARPFWDFGDGTISLEQNPIHVFNQPGYYNVRFTVTDSTTACTNMLELQVLVGNAASACLASFNSTNVIGKTYQFNSNSLGNITNYYWKFGDGSFSTEVNPTKTYLYDGIYKVELTVSNALTGCSSKKEQILYIGNYYFDCQADYNYHPAINTNEIEFNNTSLLATGTVYTWNFGDGSFSNDINPTHTYTISGNYNVCLSLFNPNTDCRSLKCKQVIVGDTALFCAVNFTYTIDSVNVKANSYPVSYKGATFGDPAKAWKFVWDFGDGEKDSVNIAPVHVYTNPGIYLVHLSLTNGSNTCRSDYFDLLNVFSGIYSLRAGFGYIVDTNNTKANSYPVTYKGATFGDPARLNWTFGDGGSDSTTFNPLYIYEDTGTYHVCLYVEDANINQSHTFCKDVRVGDVTVNVPLKDIFKAFTILTVYPNPSRDFTTLFVNLPKATDLQLMITDKHGHNLGAIVNQRLSEGQYSFELNTSQLNAGIYFIRMICDNKVSSTKLVIVR